MRLGQPQRYVQHALCRQAPLVRVRAIIGRTATFQFSGTKPIGLHCSLLRLHCLAFKEGSMLKIKTLVLATLILTLTGCALGRKVDYATIGPDLAIVTGKSVAVAVYDVRSYVLSGEKKSTFVGVSRGTYYNPFDMSTASGNPLAVDLQRSVLSALADSAIVASAKPFDPPLKSAGPGQRVLVLKVNEWKTDTYLSTHFIYDVTAQVLDEKGTVLGSRTARDDVQIKDFQEAGQQVLQDLLASAAIHGALAP